MAVHEDPKSLFEPTSLNESDRPASSAQKIADPGTDAPEVDQSVYAPQLYPLPEGLQVWLSYITACQLLTPLQRPLGEDPELFRNTEPPYPRETAIEKEAPPIRRVLDRKFPRKFIITGVLLLLAVVSISMGVGVWHHSQRSSSSSTSASTASPTASSSTPIGTSSPMLPPLVNGALNDTSLAAVSTSDGNRHLVFQDINGTLRHAQFSVATNDWLPTINFVVTQQQPRKSTPITVIEAFSIDPESGTDLNIYFVDTNNTLAATQYTTQAEASICVLDSAALLNQSILVSTSAKSLSVARIPSNDSNVVPTVPNSTIVQDEYLLFYENPTNNVSVLHGLYFLLAGLAGRNSVTADSFTDGWAWKNVSDLFYSENPSAWDGGWINAPFSATFDAIDPGFSAYFFNPESI